MSLINYDDRSHSYAVMQGNTVTNVIIALTREIAEDVSGHICVKVTTQTGLPSVGSKFVNGKFRPIQPYPSWVWSEQSLWWEAPTPLPDTDIAYSWDEETLGWSRLPDDIQELFIKGDPLVHWVRWIQE